MCKSQLTATGTELNTTVLSLKQVWVHLPGLITLLTWCGQNCASVSHLLNKKVSSFTELLCEQAYAYEAL